MAAKKRLETVLAEDTLATRIVGRWAGGGDVPLDRLESELDGASRYEIVASLKRLEKAGVGRFLAGRPGHKARFVWLDKSEPRVVAKSRASASAPRARAPQAAAAPPALVLGRPGAKPVAQRVAKGTNPPRGAGKAKTPSTPRGRDLTHSFHVRPGVIASLQLPEDVTAAEIERLCQFLQSIPFR
jgi:hypothetical protein